MLPFTIAERADLAALVHEAAQRHPLAAAAWARIEQEDRDAKAHYITIKKMARDLAMDRQMLDFWASRGWIKARRRWRVIGPWEVPQTLEDGVREYREARNRIPVRLTDEEIRAALAEASGGKP